MRLKRNRLNQYHHKAAVLKKDSEGNTYTEYGRATPFMAEMWAAGGKLQTEMYGRRLPNIRNLRIDGAYREVTGGNGRTAYEIEDGPVITVNDGICICTDDIPDYRVTAVYPYSFLTLEVERL